jgi:hypothetical protein
MAKREFLIFAALVSSSGTASAQGAAAVYISSTAEDAVGKMFTYRFRESIRSSSGLNLVDSPKQAALHARIVTLDPDKESNSQTRTIYSINYIFHLNGNDMLLNQFVGICGRERLTQCVEQHTANLDEIASEFRRELASDD